MTGATAELGNRKLAMFGLNDSDVERLVAGLAEPDVDSRRLIRGALRELGPAAVPALIRALQSDDVVRRQSAVEMLRQIDGAADAIAGLTSALEDQDWLVRLWAADALGRLRETALPAVNALEKATRDPSVPVRTAAFVALRWIRGMGRGL